MWIRAFTSRDVRKQDLGMQTKQGTVSSAMSSVTLCSLRYHVLGPQAAGDLRQASEKLQNEYHPTPLRLSVFWRCQHVLGDRLAHPQMMKGWWSLAAWQCSLEQERKSQLLLLLLSANLVTCACRIRQQDWSRSMPLSFRKTCSFSHVAANYVPELKA